MEFCLTDEQPLFPDTTRHCAGIGLRGIALPGSDPLAVPAPGCGGPMLVAPIRRKEGAIQ